MEDVKTLHGRRTKRINAANLIRGNRKTKIQAATTSKPTNRRDVVIDNVPPHASRQIVSAPSDVESAEILASLSKISQKDLKQGITLSVNLEQMDCLKDKTNNQEDEANAEILSSQEESSLITVKLEAESLTEEISSIADEDEGDVYIPDEVDNDDDEEEEEDDEDEDDPIDEESSKKYILPSAHIFNFL